MLKTLSENARFVGAPVESPVKTCTAPPDASALDWPRPPMSVTWITVLASAV